MITRWLLAIWAWLVKLFSPADTFLPEHEAVSMFMRHAPHYGGFCQWNKDWMLGAIVDLRDYRKKYSRIAVAARAASLNALAKRLGDVQMDTSADIFSGDSIWPNVRPIRFYRVGGISRYKIESAKAELRKWAKDHEASQPGTLRPIKEIIARLDKPEWEE